MKARVAAAAAAAVVLLTACPPPKVKVGPPTSGPPPVVTATIPGANWHLIACPPQRGRCIRWWSDQTGYTQGPYDPQGRLFYGVPEYCAYHPSKGDDYISEVTDNIVVSPPPGDCPT